MVIYSVNNLTPIIHKSAWIERSAVVTGNVDLAEDTSVWFGTIIRGESAKITIGRGSNIQDGSVLHVDHGRPLEIGQYVTIARYVTLHGCYVGDGSLIGVNAVVLSGARIGKNCLVGAGSVVTEGEEFPDGWMIMGTPAKAVEPLSSEQILGLKRSAEHCIRNVSLFRTICMGLG